jgi:hypothetical protein
MEGKKKNSKTGVERFGESNFSRSPFSPLNLSPNPTIQQIIFEKELKTANAHILFLIRAFSPHPQA